MTTFLAVAGFMLAVTLALIVWPLWQRMDASSPRRVALVLTVTLVPLAAVLSYYSASNWIWDEQARTEAAGSALRGMAAETERRLEMGNDPEGWRRLGNFYMQSGDYEGAARAYGRARELFGPQSVDMTVAYAEALILSDLDNLSRASQLLDEALAQQPNNTRALWYGGLAAYQDGRYRVAQAHWQRLMSLGPPPQLVQLLQQQLAELAVLVGTDAAPMEPGGGLATPPEPQQETPAAGAANDAMQLEIRVAPELEERVGPGAILYLFARTGPAGPPVAVRQLNPQQLPGTFELGQDHVMLPGQQFATAGPLTITARIAQQGDATARSGDLYGEATLAPGESGQIVIDQIVP